MRRIIYSIVLAGLLCTGMACDDVSNNDKGNGSIGTDSVADGTDGQVDGTDSEADDSDSHAGDTDKQVGDSDSVTPTGWNSCEVTSDCVLAANSCCDSCGKPGLDTVDAVNKDKLDAHFDDVCDEKMPMCPECAVQMNPELVATCNDKKQCEVIDIGKQDVTSCTDNSDCVIRTPECCACGADTTPYSLIAIHKDSTADLVSIICDPVAVCLACEPIYPTTAIPICDTDNQCAVSIPL